MCIRDSVRILSNCLLEREVRVLDRVLAGEEGHAANGLGDVVYPLDDVLGAAELLPMLIRTPLPKYLTFSKLWRDRFRLYRSQLLQPKSHFSAFVEM